MGTPQDFTLRRRQDVALKRPEDVIFRSPGDVVRGYPQYVGIGHPLALHRGRYADVLERPMFFIILFISKMLIGVIIVTAMREQSWTNNKVRFNDFSISMIFQNLGLLRLE